VVFNVGTPGPDRRAFVQETRSCPASQCPPNTCVSGSNERQWPELPTNRQSAAGVQRAVRAMWVVVGAWVLYDSLKLQLQVLSAAGPPDRSEEAQNGAVDRGEPEWGMGWGASCAQRWQ
jgi:hypothetical protein